jgi:predicted phage-related endonuclease
MTVERIAIVDRESWLELRLTNINASEIGTVLGVGAFGSLAELYAVKKRLRPAIADTTLMRRGRWLEPAVFEALAEQRPEWELVRGAYYFVDHQHRLGATPDGFAIAPDRDGRGIIQAKVITRSVFKQRWLTDPEAPIADGDAAPPLHYVLQVLTEMMLSECRWGVLAVLVVSEFDASLRLFDIERDPRTWQLILDGVHKFYRDYFDPGIMPPFEPQTDAALIRALYPKDDGSIVDLTTNNQAPVLVEKLVELREAFRRIDKDNKNTKAELTALMGAHSYGKLADGRVIAWRQQHRKGYTVAATTFRALKVLKAMPAGVGADEGDDDE